MAISFPLGVAGFAADLKIREVRWQLREFVETSGTAIGDVLTAELAAPKWTADVTLATMLNDDAEPVRALIEAIGSAGRFYLFNPARPYPRDDPDGTVIAGSTPTINTIGGNNISLRVAGLPNAYKLTIGDMLSFNYGSPTRRALHRVCETAIASAGGLTPLFEVRPPIKVGTTVGATVTLDRPTAKMMIVPGSFDPGTARLKFVDGMSFQAIEARF